MIVKLRIGPKFRRELRLSERRGGRLVSAVNDGLDKAVKIGAGEVALTQLGGEPLTSRSGQLANSVRGLLIERSENPKAVIGVPENSPAASYGRAQEEGATILPVKGKWLTIPTEKALTKSGRASRISAKDFTDLRFQPVSGTLALLVKDVGGKFKRSEIFFRLVRKVVLPATRWLSDGVRKAKGIMADVIDDEVRSRLD